MDFSIELHIASGTEGVMNNFDLMAGLKNHIGANTSISSSIAVCLHSIPEATERELKITLAYWNSEGCIQMFLPD